MCLICLNDLRSELDSLARFDKFNPYEDITDVTLARVDKSHEDEDLTDAGVTVTGGADLLLDILSYMKLYTIKYAFK